MYDAPFSADFKWRVDGGKVQTIRRKLGKMPVMVGSKLCHTYKKSPQELIRMGEEDKEVSRATASRSGNWSMVLKSERFGAVPLNPSLRSFLALL